MFYVLADEIGKISAAFDIPPETVQTYADEGIILVAAPEDMNTAAFDAYYVSGGVVVERPIMGASLSGSSITLPGGTLTLSGVLSGATVSLANFMGHTSSITADGTNITISVDVPGTWTVTVSLWPYQEEVFNFESFL